MNADARLRRRADFLRLQHRGLRFQSAHFVLYALKPVEAGRSRLGITVSRRIGNAVVRNRVKRRVRECFRIALRPLMPAGTELVVIARAGAGTMTGAAICDELSAAVTRLGVVRLR